MGLDQLTKRELAVALAARDGASVQAIADALVLSRRTVETHLGAAYRKLGVSSRAELVALVRDSGHIVRTPGMLPPALRPAERFLGRADTLDLLVRDVLGTCGGGSACVMVGGEPGIGKSALVAQAAVLAEQSGMLVLAARCESGLRAPLLPLAQALRPLVDQERDFRRAAGPAAGYLAPLFPDLADQLPPRFAVDGPATARAQLVAATLHLIGQAARERPLLLVLEDLHWVDRATATLLSQLIAARLANVAVVGTFRSPDTGEDDSLSQLLETVVREPAARWLDLTGMSIEDVRELATATIARAGVDAALLRRRTGGNPFFLINLLRADADAIGEYGGVVSVIRSRLHHVGTDVARALEAAAILGDGFRACTVADMLHASVPEATDWVVRAITGRLLIETSPGVYAFSHDLVREVILGELGSLAAARLHQVAGHALQSDTSVQTPVAALAEHFSAAAPLGEGLLAGTYGLAAAQDALTMLAPDDAVYLAQRALAALPPAPSADELRLDLLCVLAGAHDTRMDSAAHRDATFRAIEVARRIGGADALARAVDRDTTLPVMGTMDEELLAVKSEAIAALGGQPSALRNRLLVSVSYQRTIGGHGWAAAEEAELALADARVLGDQDSLVGALYAAASASMGQPDVEAQLAIVDELIAESQGRVDLLPERDGRRFRAILRLAQGDRAAFETDLAGMSAFAARCESTWVRSLTASWRALLAILDGALDRGEQLAGEVLTVAGADPNFMLGWFVQLAHIRLIQGRAAEMAPLAQLTLADHPDLAALRAMTAGLMAEAGDIAGAREVCQPLLADHFAMVGEDWLRPAALGYLAMVVRLTHGPAECRAVAELLAPYSGQLLVVGAGSLVLGSADYFRGILLAVSDDVEESLAAFDAAIVLEERAEAHGLLTRTVLERTQLLDRIT